MKNYWKNTATIARFDWAFFIFSKNRHNVALHHYYNAV